MSDTTTKEVRIIAPKGWKTINIPKKLHTRLKRDRRNLSFPDYIKKTLDEVERLKEENKTLRENNGHMELETPQDHDALNGDRFPCEILCKKFRGCTSNAMFHRDEIEGSNCFRPNYPDFCNYLFWENPYRRRGDPQHPYPKCLDRKPPIAIPKDRIIRNPQICWRCMEIKKQQKMMKKTLRDDSFKGQPRIDWGKSEGGVFDFRS